MAARKSIKKRKKSTRRKMDPLQWVAVAVIILAILFIAWLIISAGMVPDVGDDAIPPITSLPSEGMTPDVGDDSIPPITSRSYEAPPAMSIDVSKQYFATVKMAKGGEFVLQLFPDKAPLAVNNFVFLAREGYYNGTTFHRVLLDFMAQGGDPTGTGTGDPGYRFEDEPNDLSFDKPGLLAMANSGPDTNGSQFFITYAPSPWLDGKHTIFGQVTEGMDAVNDLRPRDPQQLPDYPGDAIETVTIEEK